MQAPADRYRSPPPAQQQHHYHQPGGPSSPPVPPSYGAVRSPVQTSPYGAMSPGSPPTRTSGFRPQPPIPSAYEQQRSFSGTELRRDSHDAAPMSAGGYSANGSAYRRDGSSGSSLMSPTSQAGAYSSLAPLPPSSRQPSSPLPPSRSPAFSPAPSTSSRFSSSPSSPPSFPPLPQGTVCTATADLESLAVVPLGSVSSSAAIKDLIMSRLHIPDADMYRHAFYLTRIGGGEGVPVSDDELWDAVRRSAEGQGPQVTVFVKEVVPRREGHSPETGRSAAEYAGGAERIRRERERERSAASASSVASSSAHRRQSPSTSSHASDRSQGDEYGAPGSGLRSEHPLWASMSSASRGHGSRQASAASADTGSSLNGARVVSSPASVGHFSPPIAASSEGGSGFRERSGSVGLKTSPEDYFHISPPLPSAHASSSARSSPNPPSAFHPHLPSSPVPPQHGSAHVVMGPSGPTRRLPPQPHQVDQRSHTTPSIQVTSPGWTRTVAAPAQQITVPPPRPSVTAGPPQSRPLPPQDPRSTLPQYGSQPYRNLPLPGTQSPYHNLSLQNQFSSVVHFAPSAQPQRNPAILPPRATTLAVQPQTQRMGSKSADDLRGHFAGAHTPPIPLQPQATAPSAGAASGFRPPLGPMGYPGAGGSRPPPPPSQHQQHPPPSAPASAFYSAPVQAQHKGAARASPSPSPAPSPFSPSAPPPLPHHAQTQPVHLAGQPPLHHLDAPRRPVLEQSQSQPAPGSAARPATMYDVRSGGAIEDARLAEQAHQRRQSETLEREREDAERERRTSSGSAAGEWSSPAPSAPPFQDDDGAFDGIADADRRPLRPHDQQQQQQQQQPVSRATSPPSTSSGPITPASDAPIAIPAIVQPSPAAPPALVKPRLVDEFGDPLDEETSTWFPVGQPPLSLTKPPSAPTPPPNAPPPSAPATIVNVPSAASTITTAVPAPSSYGSSSPMRRQNSAPGSTGAGGSGSETSSGHGAGRRDSVPTAQDWTQTILSRFGASTAGEEGTLVPSGTASGTGTLRPSPVSPNAPPVAPKVVDEFGDEIEEDAATFFPGHGPALNLPPKPSPLGIGAGGMLNRSSSLGSRPSLRLKIDTPTPTTSSPAPPPHAGPALDSSRSSEASPPVSSASNRRSASESDSSFTNALERINLSGRRSETSSATGGTDGGTSGGRRKFPHPRLDDLVRLPSSPFARRNSFASREQDDKDWAFRPPVETVLEHLDVFFPEHDLDKPVFDLPTPGASTPSTGHASPVCDVASSHAPPSSATYLSGAPRRTGTHLGYRKSIRVVAQDRKRMLQKAGNNVARAASGLASNLLRRKSTKLFGARIEEVTSAQMKDINAIKDTSGDDPENFSYKWIKGDLIGRGTYGHVYIALSVTTGETIAVKQVEMPRTFSDKEDQRTKGMISSLKAEIELLKDLDHPNIVLYLGMEQTPEFLSIFLEYVPGGSIGRIIRTHGKFEENVIKFFTLQILDGLGYLHSLGILHRDMKADNILIDQDGMCKISDFGTSKKSGDIYQNNENMSMQGSIFWMAPEVIHNNKQGYSAKADIWSLGCICIEMLAGSRPWEGEGFMAAMFKLGAERMRPPLPPDVTLSAEADRFVSACLAIEPEHRPKATEAKHHPFLATLDPSWSFTQTSLYRIMRSEEDRRAHKPTTPLAHDNA
ncbi:mitogen-activated protein kinase kinase kinase BCK1 [Rhodotorula paludigena]|uniref:mitogen-activated protein kinase kinase kinase BCK1 n=1 Tax=Rhodotorula paludigena TaxID=86838 RepID=UPI003175674E